MLDRRPNLLSHYKGAILYFVAVRLWWSLSKMRNVLSYRIDETKLANFFLNVYESALYLSIVKHLCFANYSVKAHNSGDNVRNQRKSLSHGG